MWKYIMSGCMLAMLLTGCSKATITTPSACDLTHSATKTAGIAIVQYRVVGSPDFREQVRCILDDDRSWAHVSYNPDAPTVTIEEADGPAAEAFCGKPYKTELENSRVSCSGSGIIIINSNRWQLGIVWRVLIVNHEIGHALGWNHDYGAPCSVMHDAGCPTHPGAIWPMVQNSKNQNV